MIKWIKQVFMLAVRNITVIKVRTPTRIDLAGGTLDIYPIPQFAYPKIYSTVNLAINIYNNVEINKLDTRRVIISSIDLEKEIEFVNIDSLHTFLNSDEPSPLMLAIKSIYFFNIEGVELKIKSEAPRGSGLGNSSSMLVAIVAALNLYCGKIYSDDEILDICQGIETSVLKIPTGDQDYIAALKGGLNRIEYELHKNRITQLPADMMTKKLNQMGVLCYVGEPARYQSTQENPNWEIFKSVVEKKGDTIFHLNKINNVSNDIYNAIQKGDWESVIKCFARESEHRIKLVKNVLSEKIVSLLYTIRDFEIDAFKICGAGGGGSILLISPEKERLEGFLKEKGTIILDFKVNNAGLEMLEYK